ncbi:hypothetical protein JNK13_02010 [bacterium]|nr:hypothetical protein [bacterium]
MSELQTEINALNEFAAFCESSLKAKQARQSLIFSFINWKSAHVALLALSEAGENPGNNLALQRALREVRSEALALAQKLISEGYAEIADQSAKLLDTNSRKSLSEQQVTEKISSLLHLTAA